MKLEFDIHKFESEHRSTIKMTLYYFCVLFSVKSMILGYLGTYFSDDFYQHVRSREVIDTSGKTGEDVKSSKWYFFEGIIVVFLCFVMKLSYDYDFYSFEFVYRSFRIIPTHWLFVYVMLSMVWQIREKKLRQLCQFDVKKAFFICLPLVVVNVFAFFASHKVFVEVYGLLYEIWSALFTAACLEELFFRGYLYELLKKTTNNKMAAVLSSLVFVIWHTSLVRMLFSGFGVDVMQNLITIWGLGIIETIIYERTNSLITCILFHAVNNGIIMYTILFIRCVF